MKIKSGIAIVIGLVISNSILAQDTTHERLVDKYYPKAKQAPPVPKTEKVNPVITSTNKTAPVNTPVTTVPLRATVTAPPPPDNEPVAPVADINKEVSPVTETATQVQAPQSPLSNDVGKINKNTNNNTKIGTDNYNPDPASPIYRDTRLGSSSPLYNTYEKNNNGAGSITTNPNKG